LPTTRPDPDVEIWPRLSRFYGLSFAELYSMPRMFLRMYAEAYPILVAEEHLHALQVVSYPYMDENDQKELFAELRDRADLPAVAGAELGPSSTGPIRFVVMPPKEADDA
jgi:hypothetical protein